MEKINQVPGPKGRSLKDKMTAVLQKNSNYRMLQDVVKVQAGDDSSMPSGWTIWRASCTSVS